MYGPGCVADLEKFNILRSARAHLATLEPLELYHELKKLLQVILVGKLSFT